MRQFADLCENPRIFAGFACKMLAKTGILKVFCRNRRVYAVFCGKSRVSKVSELFLAKVVSFSQTWSVIAAIYLLFCGKTLLKSLKLVEKPRLVATF